jgi:hypothetical protein
MKSSGLIRTSCLLAAAFLSAGGVFAAPHEISVPLQAASQCEGVNYEAEASRLLKQVRSNAARLDSDADVLATYARSSISRSGHGKQLTLVRGHVNAIGDRLTRLQAIRNVVAPWQQQAIDSVMPIAASLATHTGAAIHHVNDYGKPVWAPEYGDLLRAISEGSNRMNDTIGLHLEMADMQGRLDRLQDRADALGS